MNEYLDKFLKQYLHIEDPYRFSSILKTLSEFLDWANVNDFEKYKNYFYFVLFLVFLFICILLLVR